MSAAFKWKLPDLITQSESSLYVGFFLGSRIHTRVFFRHERSGLLCHQRQLQTAMNASLCNLQRCVSKNKCKIRLQRTSGMRRLWGAGRVHLGAPEDGSHLKHVYSLCYSRQGLIKHQKAKRRAAEAPENASSVTSVAEAGVPAGENSDLKWERLREGKEGARGEKARLNTRKAPVMFQGAEEEAAGHRGHRLRC